MIFGLKEEIIEGIKRVLMSSPEITRALIFGSRAREDFKYNSDIDLAIYSSKKLPVDLLIDLDEAAGIYKIDVVDMNHTLDEKLHQRIREQGVEIYLTNASTVPLDSSK